jgi:hypothetical protein
VGPTGEKSRQPLETGLRYLASGGGPPADSAATNLTDSGFICKNLRELNILLDILGFSPVIFIGSEKFVGVIPTVYPRGHRKVAFVFSGVYLFPVPPFFHVSFLAGEAAHRDNYRFLGAFGYQGN